MENNKIIFAPSLFFQYAICPHWIWHDNFSDPKDKGELPELTLKLFEQGVLHEQDYIKDLKFTKVKAVKPQEALDETLELMKSGTSLIYQGEIEYEADGVLFRGRPDLLKKVPGASKFGDFHYVPIDIKSSKEIHPEQKYQLILYGIILEQVQGKFPVELTIINREKETVPLIVEEKDREKTVAHIYEIISIIKGNKPPLKLVSSCKSSPWYEKCKQEAEDKNDIALLYRLDFRSHPALRENGINTVLDASKMDINSLPKIPQTSRETLERIKIQAQSLTDGLIKWLSEPIAPNAPLKIYFDIEGDPLLQVQYLFGFWIAGDPDFKYAKVGHVRKYEKDGKYYLYFLAEKPEDEEIMWKQFLQWLDLLPKDSFVVYHYAKYEKTWLSKLSEKYGSSESCAKFQTVLCDLENIRKDSVIFPLYFYSIKDIAKSKFVNFKWRHAKAGGAQSIFWYEKWLETNDRDILKDLIDYNEDDVIATEFFHTWLLNEYATNKQKVAA